MTNHTPVNIEGLDSDASPETPLKDSGFHQITNQEPLTKHVEVSITGLDTRAAADTLQPGDLIEFTGPGEGDTATRQVSVNEHGDKVISGIINQSAIRVEWLLTASLTTITKILRPRSGHVPTKQPVSYVGKQLTRDHSPAYFSVED